MVGFSEQEVENVERSAKRFMGRFELPDDLAEQIRAAAIDHVITRMRNSGSGIIAIEASGKPEIYMVLFDEPISVDLSAAFDEVIQQCTDDGDREDDLRSLLSVLEAAADKIRTHLK